MQFYLCARWSRRDELLGYAKKLEKKGHVVKARWMTADDHRLDDYPDEEKMEQGARIASEDFEDLVRADVVLVFSEENSDKKRGKTAKGGVWVEFGLALGLNKDLFLVGPRINAFCWYPTVEQFDTFEAFLKNAPIF